MFSAEIIYHLSMIKSKRKDGRLFTRLVDIMARLRGADGCPWDKRQNHATLMKYLFSEAKEVRSAVRKRDWNNLKEELGDILLQVVFHSQVAKENGYFGIEDVVTSINEKLIRRHPHVFKGIKVKDHKEVIKLWHQIKRQEKKASNRRP